MWILKRIRLLPCAWAILQLTNRNWTRTLSSLPRQIQVTFPEGTTTKNGSPVRTYMVIPSGDYSGNDAVELLIYTDKGLVTADLSVAHENTGTTGGQNNVTNDVAMGEVSVRWIKYAQLRSHSTKWPSTTPMSSRRHPHRIWTLMCLGVHRLAVRRTCGSSPPTRTLKLSAATVATLAKNQNITMNILGDITIAEDVKSAGLQCREN